MGHLTNLFPFLLPLLPLLLKSVFGNKIHLKSFDIEWDEAMNNSTMVLIVVRSKNWQNSKKFKNSNYWKWFYTSFACWIRFWPQKCSISSKSRDYRPVFVKNGYFWPFFGVFGLFNLIIPQNIAKYGCNFAKHICTDSLETVLIRRYNFL